MPNPVAVILGEASSGLNSIIQDVVAAQNIILLAGGLGAMLGGFVVVIFLRLFAKCMVWAIVVAFLLSLLFSAVVCAYQSGLFATQIATAISEVDAHAAAHTGPNSTNPQVAVEKVELPPALYEDDSQQELITLYRWGAYVLRA